jgi:hypothetical protein
MSLALGHWVWLGRTGSLILLNNTGMKHFVGQLLIICPIVKGHYHEEQSFACLHHPRHSYERSQLQWHRHDPEVQTHSNHNCSLSKHSTISFYQVRLKDRATTIMAYPVKSMEWYLFRSRGEIHWIVYDIWDDSLSGRVFCLEGWCLALWLLTLPATKIDGWPLSQNSLPLGNKELHATIDHHFDPRWCMHRE